MQIDISHTPLSIGQCATLASLLEVTVPKPGNVHRGADFEDVTFVDFAVSAVAIGPAMQQAAQTGVGPCVLSAIQATRACTGTNTNLGTVLLLAPLAAVPREQGLHAGISDVLQSLTPQDSAAIYEAIQMARPGGMGRAAEMDIQSDVPDSILDAMRVASERDMVARQYVTGFATVLDEIVPALAAGSGRGWSLATTIIHTHLQLMSQYPDSLIARKCGIEIARESAARAAQVIAAAAPDSDAYLDALRDLDFWLRSDQHRRNPGTTADLIAAGLFVTLRDGLVKPPFQ